MWSGIVQRLVPFHVSTDQKNKVYRYDQPSKYGPRVIIKQVFYESQDEFDRIVREAEIQQNNLHPSICECLGWEKEPPHLYIFSEMMDRSLEEDIQERLRRQPAQYYAGEELWYAFQTLVEGLAHLQDWGMAHRDVKPQNILLSKTGQIKICDFGFAKKIEDSGHTLLGTIRYFSPKLKEALIQGENETLTVQHNPYKSDVYSLGVVLTHLTFLDIPECFNNLKALQTNIQTKLATITQYPQYWVQLLGWMLQVEEDPRPDFLEIRRWMVNPEAYVSKEGLEEIPVAEVEEDPLTISFKCGMAQVRVGVELYEEVPCMLSLEAKESSPGKRLYPIDIVCAIDESGSMEGDRLSLVQHTLMSIIDKLHPNDRLSIISFSDSAEMKCPLLCCDYEGKQTLKGCVSSFTPLDNTNIAAGFKLSLEVLSQRRVKNHSCAVFLFTDGKNNIGVNPAQDCIAALETLEIESLTVNCFGYGDDLDTQLLEEIANRGNGVFTHIQSVDDISSAFIYEFDRISTIVARNIHVQITALPCKVPCTIDKIYSKDGSCSFTLLDISLNQRKDLVFLLKSPRMEIKSSLQCSAAEATVSYTANDGTEVCKDIRLNMKFVKWTEQKSSRDPEVYVNWYRVKGGRALQSARKMADKGEFQEALLRLEYAIEDLNAGGCADFPMVNKVLGDLYSAKEYVQDQTTWERGGAPHFASISYSHQSQIASIRTGQYASNQQTAVIRSEKPDESLENSCHLAMRGHISSAGI